MHLANYEKRIHAALVECGSTATSADIAKITGQGTGAVSAILCKLRDKGVVKTLGTQPRSSGPGSRPINVWSIANQEPENTPEPESAATETTVDVTAPWEALTGRQHDVMRVMVERGCKPMTTRDVADDLGVNVEKVSYAFTRLADGGWIEKAGSTMSRNNLYSVDTWRPSAKALSFKGVEQSAAAEMEQAIEAETVSLDELTKMAEIVKLEAEKIAQNPNYSDVEPGEARMMRREADAFLAGLNRTMPQGWDRYESVLAKEKEEYDLYLSLKAKYETETRGA